MIQLPPPGSNTPPPPVQAVGSCGLTACENLTPGNYGCQQYFFSDATSATLWNPTDIEIVYTDPSDADTFQAYISDSRNGCVRKYTRSNGEVETYQQGVFGVCGDNNRNVNTFKPTYLAVDAADIAANSVPALYVAYTEMGQIRWHDLAAPTPDPITGSFIAKDESTPGRCVWPRLSA